MDELINSTMQVIYVFDATLDTEIKKELKKYILTNLKTINGEK